MPALRETLRRPTRPAFVAALLCFVAAPAALAQGQQPHPRDFVPPASLAEPDVCGRLAGFLRENPNADPSATPVTLADIERLRAEKNNHGCRMAISNLMAAGVQLPEHVKEGIGR